MVIRPRHEHNKSTREDAIRHFTYIMDIAGEHWPPHYQLPTGSTSSRLQDTWRTS